MPFPSAGGKPSLRVNPMLFGLLVSAALILVALGAAPLTDLDEGAFAEASREMLVRGDWVSPWLLDAPRFDKPALIHWLQMVSFSVFGTDAWAARLPSALAGIVWVGSIGLWTQAVARQITAGSEGQTAGFWALLMAGTCVGILAIARASTADAVLNALLTLSLLLIWKAFYTAESVPEARKWARWAAFYIGLGLLAKGPIAFLIPGAGAILAAWSLGKVGWRRFGALTAAPWPWLIVVVTAGPWYWLQFQAQGDAFIQSFFGTHNLGRFTSTMHGFSSGPWYYPIWTLVALLPWMPIAIWVVVSLVRTGLWKEKPLWMCWGVFFFVIVFFSFSATKLPHYGFYGLSGFLVLMGLMVDREIRHYGAQARVFSVQRVFLLMITLAASSVPLWWGNLPALIADPYYRQVLLDVGQIIEAWSWWFVTPMILVIALSALRRPGSLLASGAVFCATFYVGIVLPILDAFRSPIVSAANVIRVETGVVITWRLTAPSLSFEANRVIKPGEPTSGSVVVMHTKDHDLLRDRLQTAFGTEPEIERLWAQGGLQVVRIR